MPIIRSTKTGRKLVFKSGSPEGSANSTYISRSKITGRMLFFKGRGEELLVVPAKTNQGLKYEYDGADARFRLRNYSPKDLRGDHPYLYQNYVWSPWPKDISWRYYVGGAVHVLINKEPNWTSVAWWEDGPEGTCMSNSDYLFPIYRNENGNFDDKEVADLSRGDYWDFDLKEGEYIKLIVHDGAGVFGDNRGGVTFGLTRLNYI